MSEEKIIDFLNQTREVYGNEINIEKTIISKNKNLKKKNIHQIFKLFIIK